MALQLDTARFTQAAAWYRATQQTFDGGIGAGWAVPRATTRAILDDLARQAMTTLLPTDQGTWALKPYAPDMTTLAASFTLATILSEDPGDTATLPGQRRSTFQVTAGTLDQVYTRIEVQYRYNAGAGKYDRVFYADHAGSNSPDGETLQVRLRQTFVRHGQLGTLRVDAYWIGDDMTARSLLTHLVTYFGGPRIVCQWESTLVAAHVTVGDFVTVTHRFLPAADNGQRYEIHQVRYRPMLGRMAFRASRAMTLSPIVRPPAVLAQWGVTAPGIVTSAAPADMGWAERWEIPVATPTTSFTDFGATAGLAQWTQNTNGVVFAAASGITSGALTVSMLPGFATGPSATLTRGSGATAGNLIWSHFVLGGDEIGDAGAIFLMQNASTFYAATRQVVSQTMRLFKVTNGNADPLTPEARAGTDGTQQFQVTWIADSLRLAGTYIQFEAFPVGSGAGAILTVLDRASAFVTTTGQGLGVLPTQGGTGPTQHNTFQWFNVFFATVSYVTSSVT